MSDRHGLHALRGGRRIEAGYDGNEANWRDFVPSGKRVFPLTF
jgi:hypothetical protein